MATKRAYGGAWIALVSLAAGCALPLAAPPARVAVGGGVARRAGASRLAQGAPKTAAAVDLRASVNPLGLFEAAYPRRVDIGLGYALSNAPLSSTWVSGPYLMGEYVVWREAIRRRSAWRIGLVGAAGLQFAQAEGQLERGFAGLLGVDLERSGFVSTADSGSKFAIASHGEWSLGTYSAIGYSRMDGVTAMSLVLGMQGRLPATAGVLCCQPP